MPQGKTTVEECSRFLAPFFARHVDKPLYRLLHQPLTNELVHAALDILNRGSAPRLDGFGPEIHEKFHTFFVPLMPCIIHYLEAKGSLFDDWAIAILNVIPKAVDTPTSENPPGPSKFSPLSRQPLLFYFS